MVVYICMFYGEVKNVFTDRASAHQWAIDYEYEGLDGFKIIPWRIEQ